jgi:hypothetical protein
MDTVLYSWNTVGKCLNEALADIAIAYDQEAESGADETADSDDIGGGGLTEHKSASRVTAG